MNKHLVLLSVLLLQVAAVSVSAQHRLQTGDTITGVVRDYNDGEPLFAVYVTEIDSSSAVRAWASTDLNGKFSFVLVNPVDSIKFSYYRKEKLVLPLDRKNFEIRLEDDKSLPPLDYDEFRELGKTSRKVEGEELKGSGLPIPLREAAKEVKTIDMSQFEDLGMMTIDEALVGKIADLVLILNEDMAFADYVEPKYFFIDMYRSSKVMPQDPLKIDIPGVEINGLRQIVSLPKQYYTDIENGHGYVDLGLSVKWATCNIGADSPEKTGDKYAWGEVATKSDYTWQNYRFNNGSESYWSVQLSKYNSDSNLGPVDMREVLEPEDDAAHVIWGGKWRIPTAQEFQELANNCTFIWSTLNGTEGCLIVSNKPGYTDRFIFLPTTRKRTDGVGTADGYYWSGTTNLTDRRGSLNPGPCSSYAFFIWDMYNLEIWINLENHRSSGLAIRPVCP